MIPPVLQRAWPWAAAALSGLLLIASLPPFDQGWLAWVALMPLLCAVFHGPAGWRTLALGYTTGLVFFTGTFYWLGTLAALYQSPLLLALPPLLALILAAYIGLWAWFVGVVLVRGAAARQFPNSWRNLAIGAAGASVWVALEWVRGWLFGGFGWNGLGVALHADLPMIQIADLAGVWGLSWLACYVNLLGVIIVRRIVGELGSTFLKRVRWEFSLSVALVVGVFAYGVRSLVRPEAGSDILLRVAAIQPNIPQVEKFDPQFEDKVFATLDRLTALAALAPAKPQLIIWPEATTPRPLFADEKTYHFVLDQTKRGDFGLLFGSVDSDVPRDEEFNIAALFTGHGETQQFYYKIHLVPFGEYLPLRSILAPLVGDLIPGDFTRGREYTVLDLPDPGIKLSALVCFEDTVGDLARQFVARGAQLLVNITNDGWFATSPAAEQHLANAVFRAVETRRPLIRCGNTGMTGSIDSFGRTYRIDADSRAAHPPHLLPFLQPFQEGFVAGEIAVPTSNRQTFYTRHGDWLPHLGSALGLLLLANYLRARRDGGPGATRPIEPSS